MIEMDTTGLRPWLIKRMRQYLLDCYIRRQWPVNSRTRARRFGVIGRHDHRSHKRG